MSVFELTGLTVSQLTIATEKDLSGLFVERNISVRDQIYIKSEIHELKTRTRSRSQSPTQDQSQAKNRLRRAAARNRGQRLLVVEKAPKQVQVACPPAHLLSHSANPLRPIHVHVCVCV